mmetsp:Transcript_40995/g.123700  ORF Transcript_40995/g.123700 Transcript_40995/m.123700 type:complete len:3362 (-) Transcript_40995:38-10123(-)
MLGVAGTVEGDAAVRPYPIRPHAVQVIRPRKHPSPRGIDGAVRGAGAVHPGPRLQGVIQFGRVDFLPTLQPSGQVQSLHHAVQREPIGGLAEFGTERTRREARRLAHREAVHGRQCAAPVAEDRDGLAGGEIAPRARPVDQRGETEKGRRGVRVPHRLGGGVGVRQSLREGRLGQFLERPLQRPVGVGLLDGLLEPLAERILLAAAAAAAALAGEEAGSDASSEIDEDEFLDALDSELADEDVAEWFDENWIADAESASAYAPGTAGGDRARSGSTSRRSRLRSVSDVSSLSSRSVRKSKRRMRTSNTYLSAENLARLDETGAEDRSNSDDSSESDDSFHSAMSIGGQQDLADALQSDIRQAEEEVGKLKEEVQLVNKAYKEKMVGSVLTEADKRTHRNRKEAMKIEMVRSEAEIKALRASYQDMMTQLAAARQFGYEKKLDAATASRSSSSRSDPEGREGDGSDARSLAASARSAAARRAGTLLKARSIRSAQKQQRVDSHNLTRNLNRDLIFGSVSIRSVRVELADDDDGHYGDGEAPSAPLILRLLVEGTSLTLHRRSFDVRMYYTLDHVAISAGNRDCPLMSCGASDSAYALASHYPQVISSHFIQDRFVRFVLEVRRRPGRGGGADDCVGARRSVKAKLSLGVVEVLPDAESLGRCAAFAGRAREDFSAALAEPRMKESEPDNQPSDTGLSDKIMAAVMGSSDAAAGWDTDRGSRRSDVTFHLGALNIGLSRPSGDIVGGLVVSGLAIRHSYVLSSVRSTRGQLDVTLKNLQLLAEPSNATEILGRRDIYHPLVQARVRVQLVPEDEMGGWVVDDNERKEANDSSVEVVAWNMHLGMKSQSLSATVSSAPTIQMLDSIRELVDTTRNFSSSKSREEIADEEEGSSAPPTPLTQTPLTVSWAHDLTVSRLPLRWRADAAANNVSITLPCGDATEGLGYDRRSVCATFSMSAMCQEGNASSDSLLAAAVIKDCRLFRYDNWNIIEPTGFRFDATLMSSPQRPSTSISTSGSPEKRELILPPTCPWVSSLFLKSSVIDGRNTSEAHENELIESYAASVSISALPLRVNMSAETCCLLLDGLQDLKSGMTNRSSRGANSHQTEESVDHSTSEVREPTVFSVKFPLIILKLHEEIMVPGGISHKNAKASLSMRNAAIRCSQGNESRSVSLGVGALSVYDLSCHTGICVFGPEKIGQTQETQEESIRLSLIVTESSDLGPVLLLDLFLGHTQCIIIPSLMKILLDFVSDISSYAKNRETTHVSCIDDNKNSSECDLITKVSFPFGARCLRFSVTSVGFDLILSSRDIPTYMEIKEQDPISVISTRFSSTELMGVVSISEKDENSEFSAGWINSIIIESGADTEAAEAWNKLLSQLNSKDHRVNSMHSLSKIVAVNSFFAFKNMQMLRTCIRRTTSEESKALDLDPSLCYFMLCPPIIGEQQILSPVGLKIAHTLTASSIGSTGDTRNFANIAQAVQVDIELIDILLYIRQSSGGMNEAVKVTIAPIIRMFKRSDELPGSNRIVPAKATPVMGGETSSFHTRGPIAAPKIYDGQSAASPMDLVKTSVLVGSIRAGGIQVTCVPGGATRLTENPIMKCTIDAISAGFAVAPVPEVSAPRPNVLDSYMDASNAPALSTRPCLASLLASVWIECSFSAHYHNRRLVAWEPFMEPWTCMMRLGVDVSQSLGWEPIQWLDDSLVEQSLTDQRPSLASLIQERLHDRSFSRLLRFPSIGSRDQVTRTEIAIGPLQYSSHVCHLLLYLLQSECLRLALCPASSGRDDLPGGLDFAGGRQAEWLSLHGHPSLTSDSEGNESSTNQISVSIADKTPLNMNLSGALLENLELISNELGDGTKRNRLLAPHRIRNETGMQLRFQELLDPERTKRGERCAVVIMDSGREIPLSLKRDISQSCDPHRSYIHMEMGHFRGVVGKDKRNHLLRPKWRVIGRVPVDNVGVYQFNCTAQDVEQGNDLYLDGEDATVIVRISLNAHGTKVVSVESPLLLRNTTSDHLRCEITHIQTGLNLWTGRLPPKSDNKHGAPINEHQCTPIPVNLVPMANSATISFFVGFAASRRNEHDSLGRAQVALPPPFSKKSASRGVIGESEVTIKTSGKEHEHLNACFLRIGNFITSAGAVFIPEQRLVLFRPPVTVKNHLPFPISVDIRKKSGRASFRRSTSTNSEQVQEPDELLSGFQSDWVKMGIVQCGESISWLGAKSSERVDLRVKVGVGASMGTRGGFPHWSTPVVLDPEADFSSRNLPSELAVSKMTIIDTGGTSMDLSVALNAHAGILAGSSSSVHDSTLALSHIVAASPRIAAVFVPYWIVDSTGMNFEYSTETPLAGQVANIAEHKEEHSLLFKEVQEVRVAAEMEQVRRTPQGLVELLKDDDFSYLQARSTFDVFMIGDNRSYKLNVRPVRQHGESSDDFAPYRWSEPIALRKAGNQQITIRPPRRIPWLLSSENTRQALALQARILPAPDSFGGHLGTKLVHVVNRYSLINALDRDIEVMPTGGSAAPLLISHKGSPVPFHFDDSAASLRCRPKEFGWGWSGPFMLLKRDRREVVLRLRNKLTGNIIICSVELYESQTGTTVVFSAAIAPPFRLENHSLRPLQFGQSCYLIDRIKGTSSVGDVTYLLPYHNANFAWDEPDETLRTVFIEVADFGLKGQSERQMLGVFRLDVLAPGSSLRLKNSEFYADIVADGPTRVLRISDASLPVLSRNVPETNRNMLVDAVSSSKQLLQVKLSHGIGLSVVDFRPQELIYVRFRNISVERKVTSGVEEVTMSIGQISADNQLWVTPYPVLLKVGAYPRENSVVLRKRKGNAALNLSWSREMRSFGGLDSLTLFRDVALSMEQLNIRIDGKLVSLIRGMVSDAAATRMMGASFFSGDLNSRDSELVRTLGQVPQALESPKQTRRSHTPDSPRKRGHDSRMLEGDATLTAATAARTPAQPLQPVAITSHNRASLSLPTFDSPSKRRRASEDVHESHRPSPAKPRRRYYIEKVRISSVKTDISWTGMLPLRLISLPDFLRPKLAFEGLPILLRPYSDAHLYGSLEEHLQCLKSHYINVWRVLDLLVGLAFKPTFLVRAYLYTAEQTAASAFDTFSQLCTSTGNKIMEWSPGKLSDSPYLLDSRGSEITSREFGNNVKPYLGITIFCERMIGKVMYAAASFFWGSGQMNEVISSSLKNDGSSHMLKGGESTEAARLRAPRLFANQDGKDLLVEYVEGDNAGKALLSRVSMGTYLGEGCVYHGEGARLQEDDRDGLGASIFILTTARLLLLKTSHNLNFCSIQWEVAFDQIVASKQNGSTIECWYLNKEVAADGKKFEGNLGCTARCEGLGDIQFKSIYFPRDSIEEVMTYLSTSGGVEGLI